jgi:hypothetical protein
MSNACQLDNAVFIYYVSPQVFFLTENLIENIRYVQARAEYTNKIILEINLMIDPQMPGIVVNIMANI